MFADRIQSKIEDIECTVLTLANDLVQVEVIPPSEGELSRFKAKGKRPSAVDTW